MSRKYSGLQELTGRDMSASDYFAALPEYVQEQIRSRSDNINSFESLRDYAENLLRGDD